MLILAPMQGLTELLFRKAFERCYPCAFDYAISPFLSLTHGNLRNAGKKVEDVLPELNEGCIPVVPQLLGHEADGFVELANRLYELGYNEVNWNMGCPMRRVAAKHRGSGILPYPDEVMEILDYVMPRIKPALSVKMRLGYRSSDEIDAIIPILNNYPIANVTVHPRIGKQLYSGRPDLEKFTEILPKIAHKIIYNGDIFTVNDYHKIRTFFPEVKDVMIGRGVLYNPLLPNQIRMEFPDDFLDGGVARNAIRMNCGGVMKEGDFVVSLMEDILRMEISQDAKVRKMKEYWCLLSKGLPGTEERKRKVLHAESLEAVFDLILEMTK
ncbi:MAG: tRNA-dihydrouridine synthase family protein [Bacteroidales bacterium]|nr:tRNA-dihydrouridine synthase family protein [Bacteroidales bacterium]